MDIRALHDGRPHALIGPPDVQQVRQSGGGADAAPIRAGPARRDEPVAPLERDVAKNLATRNQRTGTRVYIDPATKRFVAQILDESHQVIKQIPPEELLRIAARFRELQGVLFDRNA